MEKIKTPEEILNLYLQLAYIDIREQIPHKYETHLVAAMLEYGRQQYAIGNEHGRTYYSRKAQSAQKLNFDTIEKVVCEYFEIEPSEVQAKTRKREIVIPRQICHQLSAKNKVGSLSEIGFRFGRKDHSTVLHSIRTVKDLIKTDKIFRAQYEELVSKF